MRASYFARDLSSSDARKRLHEDHHHNFLDSCTKICVDLRNKNKIKAQDSQNKSAKMFEELQQIQRELSVQAKPTADTKQLINEFNSLPYKFELEQLLHENERHFSRKEDRLSSLINDLGKVEANLHEELRFRDESYIAVIDNCQTRVLAMEGELKATRTQSTNTFDEMEANLFELNSTLQQRLKEEQRLRQHEHSMAVKVVSECIERLRNFR